MKAEILTIGTELLLGQIINTNASYLGEQLASIGIDCYYMTTVGDNKQRIIDAISISLQRSDILIITGGLGPTPDDLTHECVAGYLGVQQDFDKEIWDIIQQYFTARNKQCPDINKKQAYRPEGTQVLDNPVGTAPGIIYTSDNNKHILTFPGVPRELKTMWQETAIPYLYNLAGNNFEPLYSKELKLCNIGESALIELLGKEIFDNADPTIAPYASKGECKLRISSRDIKKLDNLDNILRSQLQDYIYGHENENLASVVANLLIKYNKSIGLAESCTGGLISTRLTDIPGSSAFIKYNITAYSNEAKINHLNISANLLEQYGSVSEEVAIAMASSIKSLAGTDYGIGITGIAGPSGGTPDKPVGLVYYAISLPDNTIKSYKLNLGGRDKRDLIRYLASQAVLNSLRLLLNH